MLNIDPIVLVEGTSPATYLTDSEIGECERAHRRRLGHERADSGEGLDHSCVLAALLRSCSACARLPEDFFRRNTAKVLPCQMVARLHSTQVLEVIVCLIIATAQGIDARRLQSIVAKCSDSCTDHARNGLCEDGGPGSVWPDCELGTDCSDCGVREDRWSAPAGSNSLPPAAAPPPSSSLPLHTLCSDSCGTDHASNGVCEDGGLGSVWPDCELGTDCSDCGERSYTPPAPPLVAWTGPPAAPPAVKAYGLPLVAFVGISLFACFACGALCVFAWHVRDGELKGESVFKPRGRARVTEPSENEVKMAASEVVLSTPLEVDTKQESQQA